MSNDSYSIEIPTTAIKPLLALIPRNGPEKFSGLIIDAENPKNLILVATDGATLLAHRIDRPHEWASIRTTLLVGRSALASIKLNRKGHFVRIEFTPDLRSGTVTSATSAQFDVPVDAHIPWRIIVPASANDDTQPRPLFNPARVHALRDAMVALAGGNPNSFTLTPSTSARAAVAQIEECPDTLGLVMPLRTYPLNYAGPPEWAQQVASST